MFRFYIKCWCVFELFSITLGADCTFLVNGNSPVLVKGFGSRKIILENPSSVSMEDNEIISAYCPISMSVNCHSNYKEINSRNVLLSCRNNKILYKSEDNNYIDFNSNPYYGPCNLEINCNGQMNQILYESSKSLPNCQSYMTYAIGSALINLTFITAGLCFDLDTLNTKYINYLAYRPKHNVLKQQSMQNVVSVNLDQPLLNWNSYLTFMNKNSFDTLLAQKKALYPILSLHDFDYTSLVQDKPLAEKLNDFNNLLNIVWWRNLRLGNWMHYLNALEVRTRSDIYNVYTGTFSSVSMPLPTCNLTEKLTFETDNILVETPEYIWSYLQSTTNETEEIVIIGYNSPFYNNSKNVIFCEDICEKVDWLYTSLFGKTRTMPAMGLMFCCRPEEVAKKIQSFPYENKLQLLGKLKDISLENLFNSVMEKTSNELFDSDY